MFAPCPASIGALLFGELEHPWLLSSATKATQRAACCLCGCDCRGSTPLHFAAAAKSNAKQACETLLKYVKLCLLDS